MVSIPRETSLEKTNLSFTNKCQLKKTFRLRIWVSVYFPSQPETSPVIELYRPHAYWHSMFICALVMLDLPLVCWYLTFPLPSLIIFVPARFLCSERFLVETLHFGLIISWSLVVDLCICMHEYTTGRIFSGDGWIRPSIQSDNERLHSRLLCY